MGLAARFTVVAGVAQALQVLQVKGGTAFVDRDDVIDDRGLRDETPAPALLAERVGIQFDPAQAAPPCGLIEGRVRMKATALGFARRQIGPPGWFRDGWHSLLCFEQVRIVVDIADYVFAPPINVRLTYIAHIRITNFNSPWISAFN